MGGMGMLIRIRSRLILVSIACIMLVCGCGQTPEEKAQQAELAKVKKIAVICFAGKSTTHPGGTAHAPFVSDMYKAFQSAARQHPRVVEFVPTEKVAAGKSYRLVRNPQMPSGTISAVRGLTYVGKDTSLDAEFDYGPLMKSLGVDALLIVDADFGIDIRENGSSPYLTAEVHRYLVGPPAKTLWGEHPSSHEAPIATPLLSKVMLSIGARWVVMQKPSEGQCDELMQIAQESKLDMTQEAGKAIQKIWSMP
jgi:hypothetical protein